jgi:hypothetical protein
MRPQITMTMAITIETMGRLMKNLDMRENHPISVQHGGAEDTEKHGENFRAF